eukprot:2851161-Rhodomonas_salina.2
MRRQVEVGRSRTEPEHRRQRHAAIPLLVVREEIPHGRKTAFRALREGHAPAAVEERRLDERSGRVGAKTWLLRAVEQPAVLIVLPHQSRGPRDLRARHRRSTQPEG